MLILRILAAIWGACLASFITAISWRMLNNVSLFSPKRSYCESCHRILCWWQLLPVIGWLLQKGRCHFCHSPINCYSAVSELVNGWLWYTMFIFNPLKIAALLVLSISLLICSATDYFNKWIQPIWLLGLFGLFLLLNQKWQRLRLVAAIAIMIGLLMLSYLTGNGIGIGDIEFIAMLQLTTSLYFVATTILIAAGLGIIKLQNQNESLPFVPYLSLGIVAALTLNLI